MGLVFSMKMRGPVQRNTVSLNRIARSSAVLFSETVFLQMGPLFHMIGPRVSQDRTSSKTNAPTKETPCMSNMGTSLVVLTNMASRSAFAVAEPA